MSQQWIKDWVVRAVGPNEVRYFLVGSSDPRDAKEKVTNRFKGKDGWRVDDAVEPQRL